MTLEQIEAHLKKANIEQYAQPQAGAKAAAGAEALDLAATLKKSMRGLPRHPAHSESGGRFPSDSRVH